MCLLIYTNTDRIALAIECLNGGTVDVPVSKSAAHAKSHPTRLIKLLAAENKKKLKFRPRTGRLGKLRCQLINFVCKWTGQK